MQRVTYFKLSAFDGGGMPQIPHTICWGSSPANPIKQFDLYSCGRRHMPHALSNCLSVCLSVGKETSYLWL